MYYDENAKNNVKTHILVIEKSAIMTWQVYGEEDGTLADRLEEIVRGMVEHYGLEESVLNDYKAHFKGATEMGVTLSEKVQYIEVEHAIDMIYAYCETLNNPEQIMRYVRTAQEMMAVWDFKVE